MASDSAKSDFSELSNTQSAEPDVSTDLKEDTAETTANLQDLSETIKNFGSASEEASEGDSAGTGLAKGEGGATPASAAPEEVQKRLTRRSDVEFAPKIVEGVAGDVPRYLLRYRFDPDSETRWNVAHRLWKETSYGGVTRKIETVSKIVRRWKFGAAEPSGEKEKLPCVYFIDSMDLQQREEGKEPILYNSATDETVPEEFAQFGTEKMIGVELESFVVDPFGMMTEKRKKTEGFHGEENNSRVLVPFPEEPVAVGESWTLPYTLFLQNRDKSVKTLEGVKKYTLENVTGSLATIRFRTTLLSIVDDPFLEGQLAEKLFSATARFDREQGVMVKTEQEFKRTVPGAFGEGTILDYRCRITEELVR